jgi:hypothetical protein
MIQEQVKIGVTTNLINQPQERLCTETTITSDGSYQVVDDEVRDFVYSQFSDWPAESISKISWNYV